MLKTKIQEKIPDLILQNNENQIKRWENTVEKVSFNGDTFGFVSSRDVIWYTKVWAIISQSLIFIVCVFFFQESPLVQVHHHLVQDLNFP